MRLFFCLSVFLFSAQSVLAACYTPQQAEAEHVLRFHTRMMVAGMLCQHVPQADKSENTYQTYQKFTTRNQNLITQQENQLLAYFRGVKTPQPERALHSLRTDLANQLAQQASASVGRFCAHYVAQLEQAKTQPQQTLLAWILQLPEKNAENTTQPVCAATPQK